MKSPNHNEAGMLAFALVDALIAALVAKGVLAPGDEFGVLVAARDSFKNAHTSNAATCAAWLVEATKAHPLGKQA